VDKYQLGGVMAWSLGEDSMDWGHIRAMANNLKNNGGYRSSSSNSGPEMSDHSKGKSYDVVNIDGAGVGGPGASAVPAPVAVVVPAKGDGGLHVVPVSGEKQQQKETAPKSKEADEDWVWYNEDGSLWKPDQKRRKKKACSS
jgi:hypothetical protein